MKCLNESDQKAMNEFVQNCDACEKNLILTDIAFKECNRSRGSILETSIQVGVIAALMGFFIGRGVK